MAIFADLLIHFRGNLRAEIHRGIIERDAAVLYPVALQQLAEAAASAPDEPGPTGQLTAVLRSARQDGMLAVAVFDAVGNPVRAVPNSLLFVDLPVDDFLELTRLQPISRYHPAFRLDQTFAGIAPSQPPAPVLEVLLPLHSDHSPKLAGAARYYIDARPLAAKLAQIDAQIDRQTTAMLAIAAALIGLVMTAAYLGVRRAQRLIAERNEHLIRANFELTLAAKASALGQIASHLIHGLQGSVAGLRAVVSHGDAGLAPGTGWATAAGYTDRMQAMIQETVALLGDQATHTSYELTGHELAGIVRQRSADAADKKGVAFTVSGGFDRGLDGHRGGLLCLIASNLVQNAIDATNAGRRVTVTFAHGGGAATVTVADKGAGIPEEVRAHLFEPGRTGRPGGSGLGLSISQLLARQIGATLVLDSTGPDGTTFRITLPLGD